MKKKLFLSAVGIFILRSFLLANNIPAEINFATNSATPNATFEKLWIDYDVTDYDKNSYSKKGMRIHVKFTAYDMLNMDASVAIYFQHDDGSKLWLMDKNKQYYSTDGYVAVYGDIKPQYNPAVYNDFQIFMPYDELDLEAGKYKLSMDVKLIYKAGGLISKFTTYYFEYSKAGSTTTNGGAPANNITAVFKDLWVDFDITENNQKGMRIHVKFSVSKMKNIDGDVAVYFEKKDGDKLLAFSGSSYQSSTGQLAVYKAVTPSYDETDYNDVTLFIPYSEFNVASGRQDLKMDADLIYKEGGLIQHLKYYDFWISK